MHYFSASTPPHSARAVGLALGRTLALALLLAFGLTGCALWKSSPPPQDNATLTKGKHIVSTAHGQMGKKYRAGGDSPQKGFDCSGLIWWVYNKNGIAVPRITKDQARVGVAVPKDKPQPGDIVVFRTKEGPQGLHTGIYAGDRSFIHSPQRGERVRMESMDIPYWQNKLMGIRRVIP